MPPPASTNLVTLLLSLCKPLLLHLQAKSHPLQMFIRNLPHSLRQVMVWSTTNLFKLPLLFLLLSSLRQKFNTPQSTHMNITTCQSSFLIQYRFNQSRHQRHHRPHRIRFLKEANFMTIWLRSRLTSWTQILAWLWERSVGCFGGANPPILEMGQNPGPPTGVSNWIQRKAVIWPIGIRTAFRTMRCPYRHSRRTLRSSPTKRCPTWPTERSMARSS